MGSPRLPVHSASTLRLSFSAISTALSVSPALLSLNPGLRAAADVELLLAGGNSAVAHLSNNACSVSLDQGASGVGALSVELVDPSSGTVVLIGAFPSAQFASNSEGTVTAAMLCPDECRARGSLTLSFVRIDGALARSHVPPTLKEPVPLRTVGLCASGALIEGPASHPIAPGLLVSRTALPASQDALDTCEQAPAVALRLCAGAADQLGGRADLNALVAAAVGRTDAAALATDDEIIAEVLAARVPSGTPVVWLGAPRRARTLGLTASTHDEGGAVTRFAVTEDPDLGPMLAPCDDCGSDDNEGNAPRPRRVRSVTWADQVQVKPCPRESGAPAWAGAAPGEGAAAL